MQNGKFKRKGSEIQFSGGSCVYKMQDLCGGRGEKLDIETLIEKQVHFSEYIRKKHLILVEK